MAPKFEKQILFLLASLTLICANFSDAFAQNRNHSASQIAENNSENVIYDARRESLKLSVNDTIIKSKPICFSNTATTDLFILKVNPGPVKSSKSEFQIKSNDGKIIYSKVFDSFALIMKIFEPNSIPKGVKYETYINEYQKSLTTNQYTDYFNKNVQHFFENFSTIDRQKLKEMMKDGNILDKESVSEVFTDTSSNLVHVNCFDCDTGGSSVLYYSAKKRKAIEILGHD